MKQTAKLAMTILVGFVAGGGMISTLQLQGARKPAFVIANLEVIDQTAFSAYVAKVPDTLKPYNGRIVVRSKPVPKEGEARQGNIVVIAFGSLADAEKWYATPPYSSLIPERQ